MECFNESEPKTYFYFKSPVVSEIVLEGYMEMNIIGLAQLYTDEQ